MKKIMALAMVLLVLAGCQLGFFQSKSGIIPPVVKVGTQGVELSLAPGSPPPEVYEGSPFTMLVTLSNMGTADVEQGVYSVSYEPQYLYLPQQKVLGTFSLKGKTTFSPEGEERQVNLAFNTKPLGPQMQGYTTTMAFNACYPYTTTAALLVCIDPDLTGKLPDKTCVVKPQMFPQGQGAPVAVSSVEQRMMPHDVPGKVIPQFIFTIKNLGKGDVVSSSLYREACSGRPLGEDGWNVVSLSASLSDTQLNCAPATIKIKPLGDTKVVCTMDEGIDSRLGAYTEMLSVNLDYGYMNSIATQVKITKMV